ncbi:MAG: DUF2752 domain-containing protein [Patescibacteria group bacterium]|nr:DUF2752 domain-containing protein [Patescibacteria group bacterium]
MKNRILNIIGLQTPMARLTVFTGTTICLYSISYSSLLQTPTLSLFSRLNIPSPSIGLTRAYWLLIHGDLNGAWQMNKLVYLVALVLAGIIVVDGIALLRKVASTKDGKLSLNNSL